MKESKVKILFLGSRKLAENMLDWIIVNESLCSVVGVVLPAFEGWWEDELKELVSKYNVKIYNQIEDTIDLDYDLIVSVNYWKLIPSQFIAKVNGNAINIHHSYRLKFKGRYSTSWAIMHARKDNCWEHGTTIHYIDETLDNGRIIATDKVLITEEDTAETLFKKVEDLAVDLFKKKFVEILAGLQTTIPQSEITYTYDRHSKDNIRLSDPVALEDLYDFVRAWTMTGRPGPTLTLPNGRSLSLTLIED